MVERLTRCPGSWNKSADPRMNERPPQVFIELRSSVEGCYAKARIEGAPDRLPRTFVGVLGSRYEAISEATSWALGWLRRLREVRPCLLR
jgi:hypothetical protein